MGRPFQSDDAKLVRRNRSWLALGASPFLIALAAIVTAIVVGQPVVAVPAVHTSIAGAVALTWLYRRNKNPVLLSGGIWVDDEAVHHAGELLVRRSDLAAGFLVPKEGGFWVRLQRRGVRPSILVSVRDAEEGRALLRALGFDASQTAAQMRVASDVFAWSRGKQLLFMLAPVFGVITGVPALAVALGVPGLAALAPLLLLAWVSGLLLTGTRVRIGVDGIHTRWLHKERFIPYSRVQRVDRYEESGGGKIYVGVALVLEDGERIKIPAGQKGWGVDPLEVEERIREGLELHRRGADAVDPKLLARGTRDLGGWVTALRALGSGANADMRTPPVPQDKLVRIAEDAAAPPLVRAGAAVAAAGLSPEARKRVRIAAETTASPALRVALERVAAEDANDETLADALGELEKAERH